MPFRLLAFDFLEEVLESLVMRVPYKLLIKSRLLKFLLTSHFNIKFKSIDPRNNNCFLLISFWTYFHCPSNIMTWQGRLTFKNVSIGCYNEIWYSIQSCIFLTFEDIFNGKLLLFIHMAEICLIWIWSLASFWHLKFDCLMMTIKFFMW